VKNDVFPTRFFLDGTYFKSVKMTTGTFRKNYIKIRYLSLINSFFILHSSFFINIGPCWRIDSVDLINGPIETSKKTSGTHLGFQGNK